MYKKFFYIMIFLLFVLSGCNMQRGEAFFAFGANVSESASEATGNNENQNQAIETKEKVFNNTEKEEKTLGYVMGNIIKRIPINRNDVQNINALLENAKRANLMLGVNSFIATSGGADYLILSGDAQAVNEAIRELKQIIGEQFGNDAMLVDVHVSLKEYTTNEIANIGINIMPYVNAQNTNYSWQMTNVATKNYPDPNNQNSVVKTVTGTTNIGLNLESNLDLSQSSATGKVLVGSNVITPSGIKADLSSVDHSPIIIDTQGSLTTQDQTIETTVSVVPTILDLDLQNLAKSRVKVDVTLKISVPTGTVTVGGTQAMQYTEKNLTTSRIVAADNTMFIAGTFVSDVLQDSKTYIPILGEIPIIKYLFNNRQKVVQRKIAILFLSVRIVPEKPVSNIEAILNKDNN